MIETVLTHSPWGPVQQQSTYASGIYNVSTAGHGGMMIKASVAHGKFTPQAIENGDLWHGYLCYEEDCRWAIAAFELEDLWEAMFEFSSEEIKADPRTYLLKGISLWDADYLLKRTIIPVEEQFNLWLSYKVEYSPHIIAPIAHLIRSLMNRKAFECFSSEIEGKPHPEGIYTGYWFREHDLPTGRLLYLVKYPDSDHLLATEDRPSE